MAAEKKFGSVKRYGTRYGSKVRSKVGKIEGLLRTKHKCPFCRNDKVKRVSVGIWECQKCDAKFTGRAYSPDMESKEEKVESSN